MTATQTATRTTATKRVPMGSLRKTALIGGALYVLTFASSIPAAVLLLGSSVLNNPDYIVGPGPDTAVLLACFLDVINALAASAPRSCCSRWSNGRTNPSRSASSALVSWRPPSS